MKAVLGVQRLQLLQHAIATVASLESILFGESKGLGSRASQRGVNSKSETQALTSSISSNGVASKLSRKPASLVASESRKASTLAVSRR